MAIGNKEKEFKIPLNFSQLVFKLLDEINRPQDDDSYVYRVSRLRETLEPFADEQFFEGYRTTKEELFKKVDMKKYNNDIPYQMCIQCRLARRILPLLVSLCQRLKIISFEPKTGRSVIEDEW